MKNIKKWKKKEKLFNEKKRKYENEYYDDGERYTLCYSFEDAEKQKEKSSKLLEFSLKLYKLADFVNKCIENDSLCNESYFDSEKLLNFIDSHFDKDFEEDIEYYKEKFNFEE